MNQRFSVRLLALFLLTFLSACSSEKDLNSVLNPTQNTITQALESETGLADGTYDFRAVYQSPAQTENPVFTFTLKNGVVEKVELKEKSQIQISQKYQGLFMDGIQEQVVGKKLSDIGTFDRVNGSSLTPKAFNQAIAELKQKL